MRREHCLINCSCLRTWKKLGDLVTVMLSHKTPDASTNLIVRPIDDSDKISVKDQKILVWNQDVIISHQ